MFLVERAPAHGDVVTADFLRDLRLSDDGLSDDSAQADARQELFVRLLSASHQSLYAFLISLVGSRESANDLMQEVSLLLWRRFDTFDADVEDRKSHFLRWALVSARNVARNFSRLKQSHSLIQDDLLLSRIAGTRCAAEEILEIRREALQACIQKLTAADRRLLQLYYEEEGTVEAVASDLGKSADALYMALCRLRRRLFHCINKSIGLMG